MKQPDFATTCSEEPWETLLGKLSNRDMLEDLELFDISPSQWRNTIVRVLTNRYYQRGDRGGEGMTTVLKTEVSAE